jgi:predicted ATP-grasp superfamily ATP-dependent carboligase
MTDWRRLEALSAPPGVVLGLGQNGLATVRALARRGVPVIGLDENLDRPTAQTRLCLRLRHGAAGTEDALLPTLLELGQRLPWKGVLFPSGDLNLQVISEHREVLAPYFHISLPEKETVRLVLDKVAFSAWASQQKLPIPRTQVLGPDGPGAVDLDIAYPAILKPSLSDARWRAQHSVKLYEVGSPDELLRRWDALPPDHGPMLLQECIPGPDTQLVFSLTYLNRAGEPLAMFTGRKLRQFPPRFGTSSMAESRWDPEVAELSLTILSALEYVGYASVEFKRDPRDGQLRIIEVTGRTWYPHGLATRCGINLPWLAYCDRLDVPVERPRRFLSGVKWIDEDRDLRSALAYRRRGELTLAAWLASYRGRRTYARAAWDDPAPFLHTARRWASAALRPVGRLLRERHAAADSGDRWAKRLEAASMTRVESVHQQEPA